MPFKPGYDPHRSSAGRPRGVAGASAELSRRILYATDDGAALDQALIEMAFGRCSVHGYVARCACPSTNRSGQIGGDGSTIKEQKLRFEVLTLLIERAAGKATQQIDLEVTVNPAVSLLDEITPEQRAQLDGILDVDDDAAIDAVATALTVQ